jgi:hypothetical protein
LHRVFLFVAMTLLQKAFWPTAETRGVRSFAELFS